MIRDLHEYIAYLEGKKRLLKVKDEVNPELEITGFTDKANRDSRYRSSTLLFENVKGYDIPVATNLFGHASTLQELFGGKGIEGLINSAMSQKLDVNILKGAKMLLSSKPKVIRKTLSNYEGCESLDALPILKSWPKDGSRYITFPLVISKSPINAQLNVGVYRMQVYDGTTTGMHWQSQKGGAIHSAEALEKNAILNVSVAIGSDPYNMIAGVMPLPPGINEFAVAGMLRGSRTLLMENGEYPPVPLNSEFIINGHVDPAETRMEGPFGDHTGYYSLPEPYNVFHIDKIYMKKKAIYPASVVGYPWHEDAVIGTFIVEYFKPFIKSVNGSIQDVYLPPEGLFNNVCFVSIKKRFPGEAKKAMFSLLGMGQLSFTKILAVFDEDINIRDFGEVIWAIATRVEPERDIEIIRYTTTDSLDHTSRLTALGSKLLIDATKKRKEEGFPREWPETLSIPKEVMEKVEKTWARMKR